MRRILLACGLMVCVAVLGGADEGKAPEGRLDLPILWELNTHTFLESAAIAADLTGDGSDEVVLAGRDDLLAFEGDDGRELWRWRTRGRYMTYPTVFWIGDEARVAAADNTGLLTCLNGAGEVVWQAKLAAGTAWSAAVASDLDGDGALELVQTDEKGTVWCFNAADGAVRWKGSVNGIPVSPAAGDLDGHAKTRELVVATGSGALSALSASGETLWTVNVVGISPSWATPAPIVFATGAGPRIAAASSDNRLYCLDGQGSILWERPTRGAAASGLSAADFDGDGRTDVFVVTQLGTIHRFDETGRVLWDIDMQGRTLASGAIVDIDGDGALEYALSTQNGHLMVLNRDGESIFDHQFPHRTINATPAFGELTLNSEGLEFAVPGGEAGMLYAFGTPGAARNAPWAMYRGDRHNTAAYAAVMEDGDDVEKAAVRMVAENLAWDSVLCGEPIRFAVTRGNARDDRMLRATAVCTRPDGARQSVTTRILGARGTLSMPLSATAPGVYRFAWRVEDPDGWVLASGDRELSITPFANDRAQVERAVARLRGLARELEAEHPAYAPALQRQALALESAGAEAVRLQEALPGGDSPAAEKAVEATAAAVRQARQALRIAEAVEQAARLGKSVLVSEGPLWESRGVDASFAGQAAEALEVQRTAVPGEHEPVSLRLFNPLDREILVRAVVEPSEGLEVNLHRSVGVATAMGNVAWDPLPELDEASLLSVPPLETRELWLDFDLGNVQADATARVRLQVLNGVGMVAKASGPQDVPAPETEAQVAFRVLPFEMAPASSLRLCTWSPFEGPMLEDLLEHGNNVFVVPLPEVGYAEDGERFELNFERLDGILRGFEGHDVMLLFRDTPKIKGEVESDAYRAGLKVFLDGLVEYLEGKGYGLDRFALYPIDEPGGHGWNGVNEYVAFGNAVKACRPDVMVYMDGGAELPMVEAMAACTDIWTPSIYQLADETPEMQAIRADGGILWSYNCAYGYARPAGPNIKDINVVAEFRNAALFAMRYGATGIGYWCYNTGPDPWARIKDEYPLVYPGADGKTVTSRRWEAVREGVEDYRILAALRARAEAEDSGLSEKARTMIRKLAEEDLPALIDLSNREMLQGFGREAIDATNNTETVAEFREKLMACVEAAG